MTPPPAGLGGAGLDASSWLNSIVPTRSQQFKSLTTNAADLYIDPRAEIPSWARLGWAGLDWAGLGLACGAKLGWAGQAGLGWTGLGWVGIGH